MHDMREISELERAYFELQKIRGIDKMQTYHCFTIREMGFTWKVELVKCPEMWTDDDIFLMLCDLRLTIKERFADICSSKNNDYESCSVE